MAKLIDFSKKTNAVGNESKKLSGADLCKAGQDVSNQIISILSEWGSSIDGLIIETYAMGVAWAALAEISFDKGYDPIDLFLHVAENYKEDMDNMVKDIDIEK